VSIVGSTNYTYTLPYGAVVYPGAHAYFRADTALPLTTASGTRTVKLYNAAGAEQDSRDYGNTAGYSDKRSPDLTGSWSNTQWGNCGFPNSYATPTPTPTP